MAIGSKTCGVRPRTELAVSIPGSQTTISGNALYLVSNDALILSNSITLNPDAQTTISGNAVSVGSDSIVVAGSTYAVTTKPRDAVAAATTTTPDLGAVTASMYGYEPSSASSSAFADPNGGSTPNMAAVTGLAACKAGAGEGEVVIMRLALVILVSARVLGL